MKKLNLFLMAPIAASLMFACSDYVGEMEDEHSEYQDYLATLDSSSSDNDEEDVSSSSKKNDDEKDEKSSSSSSDENDDESSSSADEDDEKDDSSSSSEKSSSSSTEKSSSSSAGNTIKCGDMWCGVHDAEGKIEIPGQGDEQSGYWYAFTDNDSIVKGNSRLVFPKDVKANDYGNFYGPLTEEYGGIKAYAQMGPKYEYAYAGVQFSIVNGKTGGDITDWDGICVTYYSSVRFTILLAEENEASVTEYNNYKAVVAQSAKATVIDLPWSKFSQESGWGKKADQATILKKVASVRFRFNQDGDFAILSVGRKGSCTIDATYPPEKTFKSLADIVTPITAESSSSVASSSSVTYDKCGDIWCGSTDTEGRATVYAEGITETSGYWFDYNDNYEGGSSKVIYPSDVEADQYNNFFGPLTKAYKSITAEFQIGNTASIIDANHAGIGFSIISDNNEGGNIAPWEGICLAYTSDVAFDLEVETQDVANVTSYDNHKVTPPASATPKVVNYKWSEFQQGEWGIKVSIDQALRGIAYIKLMFRKSGNLKLFTVGRYGTCGGAAFTATAKKPCGDIWCGTSKQGQKGIATTYVSTNSTAGVWYSYDDRAEGGNSKMAFPLFVKDDDFADLITKYESITTTAKITNDYSYPYAGIGFNLVDDTQIGADISEWEGLCLGYTSTAGFNVELRPEDEAHVTEYNNYKATIAKNTSYTVVNIPWSKFKQEAGWGIQTNMSNVLTKAASITLKQSQDSDFMLYTMGRYGTCEGATFTPTKCGDIWCGTKNAGMNANTGFSNSNAGQFFAYSDADQKGDSKIELTSEGKTMADDVYTIDFTPIKTAIEYTVTLGTKYEYPFAGIGFNVVGDSTGGDITDWEGICLSYSATATLQLELTPEDEATVTVYNNHKAAVPKSSTRTTSDFAWSKFRQETGWGQTVAIEDMLKKVALIRIKTSASAGTTGDYKIYEIGRKGTCTGN